jgi:acyl-CoA reductase-like NAD-dependent aldehyde dehydrogenase
MDSPIRSPHEFFIGGGWQKPKGNGTLEIISPVTEECVMTFAEASPADVDAAVAAAREAFDRGPWPRMSTAERGDALIKVAEALRARLPEVAQAWTTQVGAPISFTRYVAGQSPDLFEYYGTLIKDYPLVDVRTRDNGGEGRAVKGQPDTWQPELVEALIEPYLAEAKAVLAEGIVADAELIDAGLIFGTGFAPFRGGPLHYLESKK